MVPRNQSLRCTCANGHKIRASQKHAGRKIACPVCGVPVVISPPEASSITDTGAVQILNDLESEFQELQKQKPPNKPARVEKKSKPERTCPRCQCEISKTDHVCPECKVILATGSRGFKQVYLAALRSLK